jgi:hypothetical protein
MTTNCDRNMQDVYSDYNIRYDIFINCSWVVTRWQYTFTHKQYIEQRK